MTDSLIDSAASLFLGRLQQVVARARARGVAVSVDQGADLVRAAGLVDVTDRDALRRIVGVTLAGCLEDLPVLDRVVDEVFPAPTPSTDPASGPVDDATVRDRLLAALTAGDPQDAALAGADAADLAVAGQGEQPMSARRGAQRVLRALDLSDLLRRAVAAEQPPDAERETTSRQRREALDAFEAALLAELRRRQPDRSEAVAAAQDPDPLDADLLHLSAAEIQALRELVRPLARRLAARARRRRRQRRVGRLDVPRTQRRALGTGGVPLEPILRRRHSDRPRVVVLCDVSGSMADHTRFTLALLQALLEELPGLRTFVFVDGVADVTSLLGGGDLLDARALLLQPGVVVGDGHSDYGRVLSTFAAQQLSTLSPRTTLVILGDARARGLEPGSQSLASLAARAGSVHWLNPEPRDEWGVGESQALTYLPHCTGMHEVQSLRQLAQWVEGLV
jgi:uncharacterized protein with von Willebrand factor type A (vWA) domain